MATLLTGLRPVDHGITVIPDNLAEKRTLGQVLTEAGYETACVQSNLILRRQFLGKHTGFDAGFAHYDDELCERADPHRGSTATEVVQKSLTWLEQRDDDQPWFLMAQFYDPHVVYEDHAEYAFEDPDYSGWVKPGMARKGLAQHQADCAGADRQQLTAYYDEEVRAVDDALANFIAALRTRDDWDDTLVVFTSDHGEELGERGYIGHTISLHAELIDLPLMVRYPRNEHGGSRVNARLPQRDLFATLLDLCAQPAESARGRSFAAALRGDPLPERPCFSEVHYWPMTEARAEKTTQMRSMTVNGYKLIRDLKLNQLALYDLRADPAELNNLAADPIHRRRVKAMSMRLQLHEWLVPHER
jgi:arylsulfatase A-like enzyme